MRDVKRLFVAALRWSYPLRLVVAGAIWVPTAISDRLQHTNPPARLRSALAWARHPHGLDELDDAARRDRVEDSRV